MVLSYILSGSHQPYLLSNAAIQYASASVRIASFHDLFILNTYLRTFQKYKKDEKVKNERKGKSKREKKMRRNKNIYLNYCYL